MSYQVYQFEAVSIQEYVLAGGKLKTMVGASELLESITNELLSHTIQVMELKEKSMDELPDKGDLNLTSTEVVFPRRAGSVFLMVLQNESTAKAFAEVWPMLVSNFAPGLKFSAVLQSNDDFNEAAKAVRDELNNQKNQPQTHLPESTPLTIRYQKTGLAQIAAPNKHKNGLDWTMLAKTSGKFQSLANKHLSEDKQDHYVFPKQFEHKSTDGFWLESFPFKSTDPGNHSVAIIHTDGNGLGGYLHRIFAKLSDETPSKNITAYSQFSTGLDKATQQAAKEATDWLISVYQNENNPYKDKAKSDNKTPLPMRPIILGGDDLTCIVRADYALGFVQAFTQAFENQTKQFVASLDDVFKGILPDSLTCTTGVLFLKSNQPFSLGYALAEELCGAAKKVGQKLDTQMPPSLINFLHTTNTLFDSLEIQLQQELCTESKQHLSRMPYAFKADQQRPTLKTLFDMRQQFDDKDAKKLNPSAVRRYAGHLHQDEAYAKVFWNRWQKQTSEKGAASEQAWQAFFQRWNELTISEEDLIEMPLADLITLVSLDIKNPYDLAKGVEK